MSRDREIRTPGERPLLKVLRRLAAHGDVTGDAEELFRRDEAVRLGQEEPHSVVRQAVHLPHLGRARGREYLVVAIEEQTEAALDEAADCRCMSTGSASDARASQVRGTVAHTWAWGARRCYPRC